jgi:peptidoglycan/LPS O-acetylase OafA/YrhL
VLLIGVYCSYDTVSAIIRVWSLSTLSVDPKSIHSNKLLSMGTGVFLLVFSVLVVVLDTSNFLAFGLAFFVLMIGIMLVMVGAMAGMDEKKKVPDQPRTEIVREIVKVRCKYCNSLNFETNERCSHCGAQI